jgi:hypothetical protein
MKRLALIAAWIVSLGLLGSGVMIDYGPAIGDVPGVSWLIGVSGPPECVVVEESANRTQPIAAVFYSKDVRAEAKACKLFRWSDPNAAGPDVGDVQWALTAAKGKTLPVVCFRRSSKVTVAALPKTPDAMVALLKKNGA